MNTVLGLDIGTNSIGWALVKHDFGTAGEILGMGSRVVPMDADLLLNFEQGNSISKTAARRQARGARRLRNRYKQRRQRLVAVLQHLGWLPEDFDLGHQLPVSPERLSEMQAYFGTDKLPADWMVYFLREKGLTEKLSLAELARVLYHMNQRRGFKSNRKAGNDGAATEAREGEEGDEGAAPRREKRVAIVKVIAVRDTGETNKRKKVVELTLEKEILPGIARGTMLRDTLPEWAGQEMELEIRTIRSKSETRLEFALPDKTDWQKLKEALNKKIEEEGAYPGQYFLHKLRNDHTYRIREQIIDRKRYEDELRAIWAEQARHHPELQAPGVPPALVDLLYKHNEEKRRELLANDLLYLIACDIIYYQRPLKSQKDSIGECRYERKAVTLKLKRGGKEVERQPGVKVAPASSPVFQEFRIWKTIHQLKVSKLKELVSNQWTADVDVTEEHLTTEAKEKLFRLFDGKEEITAGEILKALGLSPSGFKLNYESDTKFKGAETKHAFRKAFKRSGYGAEGKALLDDAKTFEQLWHLLYSVEDEEAIRKSAVKKLKLPEAVATAISKMPPFALKYAAFSAKALNKLLPLMRVGNYWSEDAIHPEALARIERMMASEWDPELDDTMRERIEKHRAAWSLDTVAAHQGLPDWLAAYLVYGRHSERPAGAVCNSALDLKGIEAQSLRNPIVEQIANETMQVVKDVWTRWDFWSLPEAERPEIRVELARDLKKTAVEREKINDANKRNREDKERIKAILKELRYGNPDSLSDIEKMRLLEENGNYQGRTMQEKFFKKPTEPTASEVQTYRLWMEQACVSPYTGKPIMLSKLFDRREYDVDHIFPQSRFYDDSMANKVIVETWANTEKRARTAMQYIQDGSQKPGRELLKPQDYIAHVERTFFRKKRSNLLASEIPQGFIQRQLNDTRHISRRVNELLFQFTQKVTASSGHITDELKHQWGLGKAMKQSLLPRFERLEKIVGETLVEYRRNGDGNTDLILKGYEKRIDHRHHAMDALVVACTKQDHVQYITRLEQLHEGEEPKSGYDYLLKYGKTRAFALPWPTFRPDALAGIDGIIVSHKNRHRTLVRGKNRYAKYVKDDDGAWLKADVQQEKGPLLSVRKPLHKETIAGTVQFREYRRAGLDEALKNSGHIADAKVKRLLRALVDEFGGDPKKIKAAVKARMLTDSKDQPIDKVTLWHMAPYALNRVALDASFTKDKIAKIAEYTTGKERGLKHLLLVHLQKWNGDPKAAFTGEGLEDLAKAAGRPVAKVSIYEPVGGKFEIRPGQLVEAAKGTNLFFVIYTNVESGARKYRTLGLQEVIGAKAQGLPIVPPEEGTRHFTLSPNDLVYVPEKDEDVQSVDWNDRSGISGKVYKMVSCTGTMCSFVPHNVAKAIVDKREFGSLNKEERSWDGQMIKQVCIKLKHDRLGNISPA